MLNPNPTNPYWPMKKLDGWKWKQNDSDGTQILAIQLAGKHANLSAKQASCWTGYKAH